MTDNTAANATPDPNATPDANATPSPDTSAADPQPGPVGLTKESATPKKKANTKKAKKPAKVENNEKPAAKVGGKSTRKRITAPARLEKLKEQWRSGNLPKGVAVSNSGGSFKAFEFVKE